MATSRDFNAMLNEHLNYDLLKAEYLKRDWLLSRVERDDEAKGGTIPVPFRGGRASSVSFGSLTDSTDIAASTYVRGQITSFPEIWGTIAFKHRDIMEHDGKISEASFLKLLPDEIDDFVDYVKERASLSMLNGYACKLTADGDASGNITTAHPERFSIGEKVFVDDDNSSDSAAGYIRTINMNSGVITIYDARTAGSVLNLSAFTVAQNAVLYFDGQHSNGFTSLRSQLLSSANGGSATLFGQTKTAYPYLQALNMSGSTITEDNILEAVFNKYVTAKNRCSGNPSDLVCSYQNGAAIIKNCQTTHGAYNVIAQSRKVTEYGYEEVMIGGPKGTLTMIMVQEMEDDVMFLLSKKGIKFHSNGWFKRLVDANGNSFYVSRATSGYSYITDLCCFGDLAVYQPSAHAIIYGISFSLSES